MKLSNRLFVIIVLLALILVATTTWAVAQSSHTYYACVDDGKKDNGDETEVAELNGPDGKGNKDPKYRIVRDPSRV